MVRDFADSIPIDLVIDIFSRVDPKSLGRCRCVSKLWELILRRQDFNELFLSKSMTRPRILFTIEVNEELLVYSSPQPRNPDNDSSLVATRYNCFPKYFLNNEYSPAFGLACLHNWVGKPRVICNLVTGESITLPKVKWKDTGKSYFGYDPINKQYKVLCMTWSGYGEPCHRILTREYGKLLWRTIQDPIGLHDNINDAICINGVLYYIATFEGSLMIVCFDFRSEEFSFINMDIDMLHEDWKYRWSLFNYKGKLGLHAYLNEREFVLWVLEDASKHKWSKIICVPLSPCYYRCDHHKIVGMIDTGEIVFSPFYLSNPFYLAYYNIERNTFTRVNVQGFEEFNHLLIYISTFMDYVENLKLL